MRFRARLARPPQPGPSGAVPVQYLIEHQRAASGLTELSHRPAVGRRYARDAEELVDSAAVDAGRRGRAHGGPAMAVPVQCLVQRDGTPGVGTDRPAVAARGAPHLVEVAEGSRGGAAGVGYLDLVPGRAIPVQHLVDDPGGGQGALLADRPAVAPGVAVRGLQELEA